MWQHYQTDIGTTYTYSHLLNMISYYQKLYIKSKQSNISYNSCLLWAIYCYGFSLFDPVCNYGKYIMRKFDIQIDLTMIRISYKSNNYPYVFFKEYKEFCD